jgi:hypothetical protein
MLSRNCEPVLSMFSLILKRASASRSSGQWSDEDYDVFANGKLVGRIDEDGSASTPPELRWFWSITEIVRVPGVATHGHAPTLDEARRSQVWNRCRFAHRCEPVLTPSLHSSGRGFGPRSAGGTLQLSMRCSSLALPPSRSLAVRVGSAAIPFACPSAWARPCAAQSAICAASATVISRTVARGIVKDGIGASSRSHPRQA